jgi:hypothetical protein
VKRAPTGAPKERLVKVPKRRLEPHDRGEIAGLFNLMLAELPGASRRRLLELPTRDLRRIAAGLRAQAIGRDRRAA